MTDDSRQIIVRSDCHFHLRRNARGRGISDELGDIDFRRGTLWQPSKFGERLRNSLESPRFSRQNIERVAHLRLNVPPQAVDRESNRGKRILQLVRDAACAFAICLQALRFRRPFPSDVDGCGYVAHPLPQRRKLGSTARNWRVAWRELIPAADQPGTPDDLVEWPAHLPAQVSRDACRREGEYHEGEQPENDHDSDGPSGDEVEPAGLLEGCPELALMSIDRLALGGGKRCRSHRLNSVLATCRCALPCRPSAHQRDRARHAAAP